MMTRNMKRSSQGFTLVEVMIAMVILSGFTIGTLTAIPLIQHRSMSTGIRSAAVTSMESQIETLRSLGYDDLNAKTGWNSVAGNGIDNVWEYDPVGGGELNPTSTLRRSFRGGTEGDVNSWTEIAEEAVVGNVTCSVVSAGTAAAKTEKFLRVTLTCDWTFQGQAFQETLYTIIEH